MVLDYSERKPVSKNRTRKQPVGIFVIILISAVSMSFALGLLSGWFLFKPGRKAGQNQTALAPDGTKSAASSSPTAQFQNPEASASKAAAPPLTFYETLPKGGKAVIGSGLNPKKNEAAPVPRPAAVAPAAPQHTAVPQPAAPPAAVKPEERKERATAAAEHPKNAPAAEAGPPKKQADTSGKFCVQIASSQDRKEAETLKAKMAEKGLPAYILESKIKDKGTWYRIRIGRHLSQQAATELAQKAGKGALVITE